MQKRLQSYEQRRQFTAIPPTNEFLSLFPCMFNGPQMTSRTTGRQNNGGGEDMRKQRSTAQIILSSPSHPTFYIHAPHRPPPSHKPGLHEHKQHGDNSSAEKHKCCFFNLLSRILQREQRFASSSHDSFSLHTSGSSTSLL